MANKDLDRYYNALDKYVLNIYLGLCHAFLYYSSSTPALSLSLSLTIFLSHYLYIFCYLTVGNKVDYALCIKIKRYVWVQILHALFMFKLPL